MHRSIVLFGVIIMVIFSGCSGILGEHETTPPRVTPAPVPTEGPPMGFALVNPNESGQTYLGSISFIRGESKQVGLRIGNAKDSRVNYTIIFHIQRLNISENEAHVIEQNTLVRFTTSVGAGERKTVTRNITPHMTGTNIRIVFLLYKSTPPATPTMDNAYSSLLISTEVTNSTDKKSLLLP